MAKLFQTVKQTNLDNLRLNSTHNPENLHISHIFLNESERKRNLNLEK